MGTASTTTARRRRSRSRCTTTAMPGSASWRRCRKQGEKAWRRPSCGRLSKRPRSRAARRRRSRPRTSARSCTPTLATAICARCSSGSGGAEPPAALPSVGRLMAAAGAVRERRRTPRIGHRRIRGAVKMARHVAAVVLVVVATLFGAFMALKTYTQTQELSVGRVQISIEPGHKGALDLYVPLVDWGVRFEDAIRLPVRLHVDLRTVDRGAVAKIANGGNLDLQDVRGEAREAIKSYLLNLIGIALVSALALGTLVALAIRHRSGRRLRYRVGAAVLTTVLIGVALVTLLPPRGTISDPQYYAFGPDIPRALQAVEAAQASTKQLDQEVDAQLVGLARLVTRPSERTPITNQPTITIASDLHNNFIALPILEKVT